MAVKTKRERRESDAIAEQTSGHKTSDKVRKLWVTDKTDTT